MIQYFVLFTSVLLFWAAGRAFATLKHENFAEVCMVMCAVCIVLIFARFFVSDSAGLLSSLIRQIRWLIMG